MRLIAFSKPRFRNYFNPYMAYWLTHLNVTQDFSSPTRIMHSTVENAYPTLAQVYVRIVPIGHR